MPKFGLAFFLLLISGSLVFFFVRPQWRATGVLRTEIEAREAIAQELTGLVEKSDELISQYRAIPESELEKIRDLAPVGRQTTKALVDFEALAATSRITLQQVDFSGGETESALAGSGTASQAIAALTVKINFLGDYTSAQGFLAGLERSLRIFDTTNISFSSGDTSQFPVSLSGKIYYQP